MPARIGGALEQGSGRITAQINGVRTGEVLDLQHLGSSDGDPGVFIPDVQLGAAAWMGIAKWIEVGAQFQYASLSWASPNAVGVLDFPADKQEDMFLFGLGARGNFELGDSKLTLSPILELNAASVSQAVFVCSTCTNDFVPSNADYTFERLDREVFILPNTALQLSYAVLDGLRFYAMLGAQLSVTNVGFDADISNLPDTTLENFVVGYFAAGVEAQVESFVVSATFMLPIEDVERIDFGPTFAFQIGAHID